MIESKKELKSIKIRKNNVLKFGILDENNNDTGEYLEFDLEDIELPLRYQEAMELHKKNLRYFQTAIMLIDKKPDHVGKKLLSANQEAKQKKFQELYQKEMEAFDYAFGEGTCRKLLNGRKPFFTMFDTFTEMLKPVMPVIEKGYDKFKENIKKKYSVKEDDVLE